MRVLVACLLLCSLVLVEVGCLFRENGSPYYGRIIVPQKQEFKWSDGGLPQVFDPAFAAAPPDTDAVRALFEGLTDYDPQTLKPVPAVATRWESSDDGKVWTFYLRDDARWSSGEPVTAKDFARSWERTLKLSDQAPHTDLLSNIVGAQVPVATQRVSTEYAHGKKPGASRRNRERPEPPRRFGVEAVGDRVLRVHLVRANPEFPALAAHPVFRPVKLRDEDLHSRITAPHVVSNGAFKLAKAESDQVLLERAENYWDKADVSLERIQFVGTQDPESALAAYRAGEVDAVTNAAFEPLALKLLKPYRDYRRGTYSALTYYTFNTTHAPFDDIRIREALAIAIDRERISNDELGGATEPADRFVPRPEPANADEAVVAKSATLERDISRARHLFAEAGFANGKDFPRIRLLINRNDQQRQVAQAIAAMWHNALNVETEVIVRNWDEYEAAIRNGDYDLVRRGVVMQTTDELTNMNLLFPPEFKAPGTDAEAGPSPALREVPKGNAASNGALPANTDRAPVANEAEALGQLRAIPIYFASSYSLIKPYVTGFDTNLLDAPSLKKIKINSSWQEPKAR